MKINICFTAFLLCKFAVITQDATKNVNRSIRVNIKVVRCLKYSLSQSQFGSFSIGATAKQR